jgi:hypothetical protein
MAAQFGHDAEILRGAGHGVADSGHAHNGDAVTVGLVDEVRHVFERLALMFAADEHLHGQNAGVQFRRMAFSMLQARLSLARGSVLWCSQSLMGRTMLVPPLARRAMALWLFSQLSKDQVTLLGFMIHAHDVSTRGRMLHVRVHDGRERTNEGSWHHPSSLHIKRKTTNLYIVTMTPRGPFRFLSAKISSEIPSLIADTDDARRQPKSFPIISTKQ